MIIEETYLDGVLVRNITYEESDLSTQEQRDNWLSVCSTCELNLDGICGSCGCILLTKMTYSDSRCPENKW